MDLDGMVQSLRDGFAQLPPVTIVVVLLAGPTALFVIYRFISLTRRAGEPSGIEAAALWVCHDCRSLNPLRQERCYRCGSAREAPGGIRIVLDRVPQPKRPFDVPAGSPFAPVATGSQKRESVPVMDHTAADRDPVAVGPGRDAGSTAPVSGGEQVDRVEADR